MSKTRLSSMSKLTARFLVDDLVTEAVGSLESRAEELKEAVQL